MYFLWISLFITSIGIGVTSYSYSTFVKANHDIQAELFATDIISYRKAITDFKTVNPSHSGSVSRAQYTPFLLWGDSISNSTVRNTISSDGKLYVWNAEAVTQGAAFKVYEKLGKTLFIGFKRSGMLVPLKNSNSTNTGIALPAVIPDNAFVIYGE